MEVGFRELIVTHYLLGRKKKTHFLCSGPRFLGCRTPLPLCQQATSIQCKNMQQIYGQKLTRRGVVLFYKMFVKVKRTANIGKRYNQVPHLSQDAIWENNKNRINITNNSQEVSPFP